MLPVKQKLAQQQQLKQKQKQVQVQQKGAQVFVLFKICFTKRQVPGSGSRAKVPLGST